MLLGKCVVGYVGTSMWLMLPMFGLTKSTGCFAATFFGLGMPVAFPIVNTATMLAMAKNNLAFVMVVMSACRGRGAKLISFSKASQLTLV